MQRQPEIVVPRDDPKTAARTPWVRRQLAPLASEHRRGNKKPLMFTLLALAGDTVETNISLDSARIACHFADMGIWAGSFQ